MPKILSIPSAKEVSFSIENTGQKIAFLLIMALILLGAADSLLRGINGRVDLYESNKFGVVVFRIIEEKILTKDEHLARMDSLRSTLATVNEEVFLNDGVLLSNNITLEKSTSSGEYQMEIRLEPFEHTLPENIRDKYLDALKDFYRWHNLQVYWAAGISG